MLLQLSRSSFFGVRKILDAHSPSLAAAAAVYRLKFDFLSQLDSLPAWLSSCLARQVLYGFLLPNKKLPVRSFSLAPLEFFLLQCLLMDFRCSQDPVCQYANVLNQRNRSVAGSVHSKRVTNDPLPFVVFQFVWFAF